jgi:hypothetical protein
VPGLLVEEFVLVVWFEREEKSGWGEGRGEREREERRV